MPWQNAGMKYLVGDLQGCGEALDRLLVTLGFSPSRDHACFLGDLVNRGPASLTTLRRLQGLGSSATCLLGNHDLHLLAVTQGVRPVKRGDTLNDILSAPDRSALIDWIRHQRMAVHEQGWLMVHAGVVPQWDLAETLRLAGEVERHLRSPGHISAASRSLPAGIAPELRVWLFILYGALHACKPGGRVASLGQERSHPGRVRGGPRSAALRMC